MAKSSLVVDSFWRKGEKQFPLSKSNRKRNKSSGIRVVASEAEFSEFSQQIEDVVVFLRDNRRPLRALMRFPGIESVLLDFGAAIRPPGWASFSFPNNLLLLAGAAGVSLCLSVYPCDTDGET